MSGKLNFQLKRISVMNLFEINNQNTSMTSNNVAIAFIVNFGHIQYTESYLEPSWTPTMEIFSENS